jgi:hypothetical protein
VVAVTQRTRRQFLRNGGAAGVALAGGTAVGSAPTAAADEDVDIFERALPESVDVDLQGVADYQPALQTSHLKVTPLATYAARFTSPDRDTDAYCYWTQYPWQTGWSSYDSHQGDREPITVFVREDGSLSDVAYSSWHWLAATSTTVETADGQPLFRSVKPHHHVVLGDPALGGSTIDRKPLVDLDAGGEPTADSEVQEWYDNGWTDIDLDVLLDPWRIRSRRTWWSRESGFGIGYDVRARWALRVAEIVPWRSPTTDL